MLKAMAGLLLIIAMILLFILIAAKAYEESIEGENKDERKE